MIFINGNIITMDPKYPYAQGFVVRGNLIFKVGLSEDVLKVRHDNEVVIDLEGQTVVPGFNDSHVHLLNFAYGLHKLDVSEAESLDEIVEMGRAYIEKNHIPKGQWVVGRGWNQLKYPRQEGPDRLLLDRISTDHPIALTRICEHITVANSKAIDYVGITYETLQPEGGFFSVDETGCPTGIFNETARYLIYDCIPDPSDSEIKKMLIDAGNFALSFGITSVHTDDFEALPSKDWRKVLRIYRELVEERVLPIRVYEQCLLPHPEKLKEFINDGNKTGLGDDFFKIGPLKLLTDGSLGGRTALLNRPYDDDPSTNGIAVFSQEELDSLSIAAHENGMHLVFHGIGDRALDMIFSSFEKALKQKPIQDPRFGIIHLQITNEDHFRRFKMLNVVAYAEPISLNNDIHMVEQRIGMERAKTAYNYKSLLDQGVKMALSTDCPVDDLNPMKNIYVAVNRQDYKGYPEKGWRSEESLTVEEALYAYTIGSAYASFEENIKGSIEPGKFADFAILDRDILSVAKADIQNIKVLKTYVNGKCVFKR